VIVTALALAAGRGPARAALMASAVLAGQLFVGWTNDFLDADRDRSAEREDKPIAAGQVPVRRVRAAAAIAALLTVPLSLATGPASGAAHLTAVAAATAYNLGLKRTPLSVVPYALAFGLVPTFVTAGPPITHLPPAWATAAAALLGAGAHFTQTLTGLDGLPKLIGRRAATLAGPTLMTAAAAVAALAAGGHGGQARPLLYAGLALTLAIAAATLTAAAADHPKLAFRLTLATAAVVTATVVLSGTSF